MRFSTARRSMRRRSRSLLAAGAAFTLVFVISLLGAWQIVQAGVAIAIAGVFLAYLLAPTVDEVRRRIRSRRRRPISRGVAIAIVFAVLFGLLETVFVLVVPRLDDQVMQLRLQAPRYLATATSRLRSTDEWVRSYLPGGVHAELQDASLWVSSLVYDHGIDTLNQLLTSLPYARLLWLAPLVAVLLLRNAHAFRRSAIRRLPRGHMRWRGREFFRHLNSTLAGYVRAVILSAFIVGFACCVGFALLGVPYAVVLGVIAGVLEMLPIVGPLAVALVASSMVSAPKALLVLLFLGALRVAEDYVILPRLLKRGMHLHPAAVVLAVWLGAQTGGIAGVFIAIPIVGLLSVWVRHWREYRDIERLVAAHARTNQVA